MKHAQNLLEAVSKFSWGPKTRRAAFEERSLQSVSEHRRRACNAASGFQMYFETASSEYRTIGKEDTVLEVSTRKR